MSLLSHEDISFDQKNEKRRRLLILPAEAKISPFTLIINKYEERLVSRVSLSEFFTQTINTTFCKFFHRRFGNSMHLGKTLIIEGLDEIIEFEPDFSIEFCKFVELHHGLYNLVATARKMVPRIQQCFDQVQEITPSEDSIKAQYQHSDLTLHVEEPNISSPVQAQFGGMKETQKLLLKITFDSFSSSTIPPVRGIIFAGPPGTGKTFMARMLASKLKCNFIVASLPELVHAHLGDSERAIGRFFSKALSSQPALIFLDELDSVFRQTGHGDVILRKITGQLLHEFDRLARSKGARVLVLAATNLVEVIDERLLRADRFELVINFELPDEEDRLSIFKMINGEDNVAPFIDHLVARTRGMNRADIAQIANQALKLVLSRSLNDGCTMKYEEADFIINTI